MASKGPQFWLHFGGPEINGYPTWLDEHHGRSPLYLSDNLPITLKLLAE
jgi:hypothetical protein